MIRLLLLTLLLELSGCAWISVDHYFASEAPNSAWQATFKKGKNTTKFMGYPDTQIHRFSHPEFELEISMSYQDTVMFGPVIVPIIPLPWDTSKQLLISGNLDSSAPVEIDTSNWWIKTSEGRSSPSFFYTKEAKFNKPTQINLEGPNRMYIGYDLQVAELDVIWIEFGPVYIDGEKVEIPTLKLIQVDGTWRYGAWTL